MAPVIALYVRQVVRPADTCGHAKGSSCADRGATPPPPSCLRRRIDRRGERRLRGERSGGLSEAAVLPG